MPEAKDDLKREKVRVVPISNIEDFPDHPFQVKDDESMAQLVESIRMNGVLNPVIALKIDENHYQLISGHRRKHACILLGIFTVSYNANGGSGAPASQTKTIGQTVTISTVQPTRTNHAFMGWATSSTATTPEYYGGETYYADASVTLYAVWIERNYDLSVSNFSTTPGEVYQYEKISIMFRADSF